MKILFLNLYSGAVERGAESFAHSLAAKLEERGHRVDFVKGGGDQIPADGFRGSIFSKLLKRLFLDRAGRAVLKYSISQIGLIWQSDFEVIIPMNGFWQVLILKLMQPLKRFRIIITGHSGPGWDERWNLYLKPDVFVASTGPMEEWAKRTCSWTKVVLIPYGIDRDWSEFFRCGSCQSLSPVGDPHSCGSQRGSSSNCHPLDAFDKLPKPIILCPCALVPYKRVDLAIRAVAKLEQGSLVVVGKGELEKELKKLGEKLLPGRFLLTSVPYMQMPAVYKKSDLVTLPSSPQENSPMVFVEALVCGKIVVATDAPRVRWALEEAGFYVDPQKLSEYADTLMQALQADINTSAPLDKFLWVNVLSQYETILESDKNH